MNFIRHSIFCISFYVAVGNGYRLPNTTVPIHYDLFIDTNIHEGDLDYNGTVKIFVKVLENTNEIVLHSTRSTLVELEVKNSDLLPLPVRKFEFENEKEFLTVHVASELKAGSIVLLEMAFVNSVNRSDQRGFYRTSYTSDENVLKYAALTQFQACDARSAFPCYDEPGIKATFTVRIACGVEYHARSNAEMTSVTMISNKKKLVKFKRTPRMQTYLLAFLVSDFAVQRDYANATQKITVQSLARPTHADQLAYSIDASVKLIDELQTYFDHPYELKKIDNVGIPNKDFAAGAMENWGLVTYLESYLLVSSSASDSAKREVVVVIAHEFAHQFFGNLLAPRWWSFLWLNEGFATLYEYYLSDRTHPELLIKERFPVLSLQQALLTDGSATVRPMTHYVETVPEIDRLFDRIAYDKSGSVLRMLQYALGEQTFLKGIRHYIKENQNSAVEPQNLYDGLQHAAIEDSALAPDLNITEIMQSWATQPGAPVVTVKRTSDSDEVNFTQQRFFRIPGSSTENDQTWWIPIFVYTNSSNGEHEKTPLFWIPQGSKEIVHNVSSQPDDVFLVNPAQTGYYRVNYDPETWRTLIKVLHSNPDEIDPISRGQLIDDSMNLANAGLLDHEISFNVLDHMRNSSHYLPWQSAYRNLLELDKMLSIDLEAQNLLRQYILALGKQLFETYETKERQGESTYDHDARLIAIDLSCRVGQQECMQQATAKLSVLGQRSHRLVIHTATEQQWYCNAMRSARTYEVDLFREALEVEEDSVARSYLINSLACVGDRSLLQQVMATLAEDAGNSGELYRFLSVAADSSTVGTRTVIEFLSSEGSDPLAEFTTNTRKLERLIVHLADRVVDRVTADELLRLTKVLNIPRDLAATISAKLDEQVRWQERNVPLVRQTLMAMHVNNNNGSSSSL